MEFRILCFHGYQQTKGIMKKRMEKLEKEYMGIIFEYAESILDNMWYQISEDLLNNNDLELNDNLSEEAYKMIEDNFIGIDELLKTRKYDGFIGFSQGSIFARWYILLV